MRDGISAEYEAPAAELTAEERARVVAFFDGDSPFPQHRFWRYTARGVREARARNNVERPSNYGALIHDLLTTCALALAEIDALRLERGTAPFGYAACAKENAILRAELDEARSALATARAEGRAEGMEAAAGECDRTAALWEECAARTKRAGEERNAERQRARADTATDLAIYIRALAASEATR